jgi:UDPglucose 6-dehydrogenase
MPGSISVIGTGYLGATHAACMAELGHDVIAYDVDATKIAALADGVLPFFEPGLEELLREHTATGRLRFTSSIEELAERADVHFICVGTPQRPDGLAADTSHVEAALRALVPHLTRSSLVVGKSTVPVGTAARLHQLAQLWAAPGVTVEVAWNPEFLREGHAVQDTLRPDRVVLGVSSPEAEKVLRFLYDAFVVDDVPVLVTDLATAELVKSAANAFLATKITFANAMAELCDVTGADVVTLADALGLDRRIGRAFLGAGIGFGGGCLPKDIRALMASALELGADDLFALLREVDSTNMRRRDGGLHDRVAMCGGTVAGARIACLGAAFKPGTDDIRDSPALDVAAKLQRLGADAIVFDPQAVDTGARAFPSLTFVNSVDDAIKEAELVMLLTEWPELVALDPRALHDQVGFPRILDGRNALDPDLWRAAGWTYRAPGRPGSRR